MSLRATTLTPHPSDNARPRASQRAYGPKGQLRKAQRGYFERAYGATRRSLTKTRAYAAPRTPWEYAPPTPRLDPSARSHVYPRGEGIRNNWTCRVRKGRYSPCKNRSRREFLKQRRQDREAKREEQLERGLRVGEKMVKVPTVGPERAYSRVWNKFKFQRFEEYDSSEGEVE